MSAAVPSNPITIAEASGQKHYIFQSKRCPLSVKLLTLLRKCVKLPNLCNYYEVEKLSKLPKGLDRTPGVLPVPSIGGEGAEQEILTGQRAMWWMEQAAAMDGVDVSKMREDENAHLPAVRGGEQSTAISGGGGGGGAPAPDFNNLQGFNALEMGGSDVQGFISNPEPGKNQMTVVGAPQGFTYYRDAPTIPGGAALGGAGASTARSAQALSVETPTVQSRELRNQLETQRRIDAMKEERMQLTVPRRMPMY